jgi:hypothetical protein
MIKITKLPKSEVEIEGEIEADVFEGYYGKALKKLGEKVEIDGFRKGKVPENVLISKIPESHILEEMAEMALMEYYPKMLEKEKTPTPIEPQVNIMYNGKTYNFKIEPDATAFSELKDMIFDKLVEEEKISNKNYTVTFNFSGKMYNMSNEETANKLISAIIGTNYYAVMRLILKPL